MHGFGPGLKSLLVKCLMETVMSFFGGGHSRGQQCQKKQSGATTCSSAADWLRGLFAVQYKYTDY